VRQRSAPTQRATQTIITINTNGFNLKPQLSHYPDFFFFVGGLVGWPLAMELPQIPGVLNHVQIWDTV